MNRPIDQRLWDDARAGDPEAVKIVWRLSARAGDLENCIQKINSRVPLTPLVLDNWETHLKCERLRRYTLAHSISSNEDAIAMVMAKCISDPVWWCNNFVWTIDPLRADGAAVPFVLQNYQILLFLYVLCEAPGSIAPDGTPVKIVIEKGRELGATYTIMIALLWLWLFRSGIKTGIVSRTGDDVWNNTESSLFGKIRQVYQHLPQWMRPTDWLNAFRASSPWSLIHPDSQVGNSIIGSKTTDNVFRSGRFFRIFGDEWAAIPRAESTARSINGSTEGAIFCSTPNGPLNHFARLTHGEIGEVLDPGEHGPGWRKFRMHYTQDARKDDAWLSKKRAELSTEEFEQEHNISYESGSPGRYWPEYHPTIHLLRADEWRDSRLELFTLEKVEYQRQTFKVWTPRPSIALYGSFDFGLYTSCVIGAYNPEFNDLTLLQGWLWYDTPVETCVSDIKSAGYKVDDEPGTQVHFWVGDPAGKQRLRARKLDDDAQTWIQDFEDNGISIQTKKVKFKESMNLIRRALNPDDVRLWLAPQCAKRNTRDLPSVSEGINGYRMHLPKGNQSDYKISAEAPKHGGPESHIGDVIRYKAAWIWDENKAGLLPLYEKRKR
jgi:hypothetical protein